MGHSSSYSVVLPKKELQKSRAMMPSDRGHEGVGEVAGGVDAGHAGLAALVDLEDDASRRIRRCEAQ